MNKIIYLTCLLSLLTGSNALAQSSNAYIGIDAIKSFAQHKYLFRGDPDNDLGENGKKSANEANGLGISLGYKFSFGKTFIAPEIFYDYLGNSARGFDYNPNDILTRGYSLNVDQRYGTKIYLGYNFAPRTNFFVNAGVAGVEYSFNRPSLNLHRANFKPAMIYGAGLSFDVVKNLQLRLSYDWQQFKTTYDPEFKEYNLILLETTRIGVIYSF